MDQREKLQVIALITAYRWGYDGNSMDSPVYRFCQICDLFGVTYLLHSAPKMERYNTMPRYNLRYVPTTESSALFHIKNFHQSFEDLLLRLSDEQYNEFRSKIYPVLAIEADQLFKQTRTACMPEEISAE